MSKIHPTAIIDAGAEIANDVMIGPGCVIESDVKIGAGCVLREYVVIRRHTTLGGNNFVDAFSVLGGEPQDLKFDPSTVSHVRIGDDNVFREHVTISRATGDGNETVVGSGTYWMAGSHAGHNAVVADEVILGNCSAAGGHATIGRKAILSGGVMVHQYTWVGEMVMTQGHAGLSAHLPPYTLLAGINKVIGLNSVGLRRAEDISDEDREQVKDAFRLIYRSGLSPAKALEKMDACSEWGVITAEPPYTRGLCPHRSHS